MTVVEPIDLENDIQKQRISEFQRHTFGGFSDDLYDHILRRAPRGAIAYGIYEADRLVAFNAFTGHSVHRAGQTGIAYQSGMVAAHKDHRGRGYFSKIVNYAQADLKARGGAFIFGFPTHELGPAYVKKLGFTLVENRPCFFLGTPVGLFGQLNSWRLLDELAQGTTITFDMRETAAWKSEKDASFFEMDHLTNYLFRKVQIKEIKGMPVRLMVIGGYEINKPHQMGSLITRAMRRVGAPISRTNAHVGGPLARASRLRRSPNLTESTIAYSLNWDVKASNVEACGGLKDVY